MDNTSVHTGGSSGQSSRLSKPEHGRHIKKKVWFQKILKPLIILFFVALIVFGSVFLYGSTTSSKIDKDKYQVVFFTNGLVYFGKLKIHNGGYMSLTDVYYLQKKATANEDSEVQSVEDIDNPDVELIKLGEEIYGPMDEVVINKDQVLFFENLKIDGKVTQAIVKYKSENN